jgi:predicted secreted protein
LGDSDTKIVKIRAGQTEIISLPSNPTTGYKWHMQSCSAPLKCRELPLKRTLGGIGAGGWQRFEIGSEEKGEYEISFILKRHWEGEPKETRTLRIIVN